MDPRTVVTPSLIVEVRDEYAPPGVIGQCYHPEGHVTHLVEGRPPRLIVYTPEHNSRKIIYVNGEEYVEDSRGLITGPIDHI